MDDSRTSWLREQLATGAMNALWTFVTLALLVLVHYLWPYHGWAWGLILGAGVGGGAVFLTVWIAGRTRLPRLLGVSTDV